MNFSEFQKLMGADPLNRDEETLRARRSSPEFEAVAVDAEAFEEKLQGSIRIQAPDDLLSRIMDISQQQVRPRRWMPLALAASLLVFAGAAGLVWKQNQQWDSVEDYVADHFSHDGTKVFAKAAERFPEQDITRILSRLNAGVDEKLATMIKFIKFCPTPDGRGAHMVVQTDQGLMTLIYMPNVQITESSEVNFDQWHASLVNLEHGSVAVIGNQAQRTDEIAVMVRGSLKTGQFDA